MRPIPPSHPASLRGLPAKNAPSSDPEYSMRSSEPALCGAQAGSLGSLGVIMMFIFSSMSTVEPSSPPSPTHRALRSINSTDESGSSIRSSDFWSSPSFFTKLSVYVKPVTLPQSLAIPMRTPSGVPSDALSRAEMRVEARSVCVCRQVLLEACTGGEAR
eukprot:scaffold99105_cov60-Phaeocystis_antarctica.AAC.10